MPFRMKQANSNRANNAVQLQGSASDLNQLRRVVIERDRLPNEAATVNQRGRVVIGEAKILKGAPPTVPGTFTNSPHRFRSCWELQVRREMISNSEPLETALYAVAENAHGGCSEIGRRQITFVHEPTAKPFLFCSKPFDSILIDSRANVSPYPDCRVPAPYGNLGTASSLEQIWHREQFRELRRRIINRDPPAMCLTCAHFINSNVNDPAYFLPR